MVRVNFSAEYMKDLNAPFVNDINDLILLFLFIFHSILFTILLAYLIIIDFVERRIRRYLVYYYVVCIRLIIFFTFDHYKKTILDENYCFAFIQS